MSHQWIFDIASEITWNRQPVVAQTIARSGMIRSVSRSNSVWQFTVTPPSGIRYSLNREYLEDLDNVNNAETLDISLNNTGYSYIFGYRGDFTTLTSKTITIPAGYQIVTTLTDTNSLASGYKYRKGDIINLLNHVYVVTADVSYNSTLVPIHRPLIPFEGNATLPLDAPYSTSLAIGQNCVFKLKCVERPTYTLTGYDQISWSGSFVYQEAFPMTEVSIV